MSKIGNTTDYVVTAPALDDMVIGTDVSNTSSDPTGETVNFMWSGVRTLFGISENYTFPSADGTADQVLVTDGAGALTFADAGGGGSVLELYAEKTDNGAGPVATGNGSVGIQNEAIASGIYAFAAGRQAEATALYAMAVGSQSDATENFSSAFGYQARAIGGTGAMALAASYASGQNSFAAGIGMSISSYGASGKESMAIGRDARAAQQESLALGAGCLADSIGSGAIGFESQSLERYAMAYGALAVARVDGTHVFGTKHGLAAGTIQSGLYIMYANTSGTTVRQLTTNGGGVDDTNSIALPPKSAFSFHGTVVARQQSGAGTDCAAFKIEGLLRREAGASTIVLVNSIITTISNEPGWGLALVTDTADDALQINVTGASSTNVRWVASIHTSEVIY